MNAVDLVVPILALVYVLGVIVTYILLTKAKVELTEWELRIAEMQFGPIIFRAILALFWPLLVIGIQSFKITRTDKKDDKESD
ncbi:hypothetical protein BH09PAT2_BH09PAT2_07640 [soil metagenome]